MEIKSSSMKNYCNRGGHHLLIREGKIGINEGVNKMREENRKLRI